MQGRAAPVCEVYEIPAPIIEIIFLIKKLQKKIQMSHNGTTSSPLQSEFCYASYSSKSRKVVF